MHHNLSDTTHTNVHPDRDLDADTKDEEQLRLAQAVDTFAHMMKARLLQKLDQGYIGWDDPQNAQPIAAALLDDVHLLQACKASISLDDPLLLDIANRAMFLYFFNTNGHIDTSNTTTGKSFSDLLQHYREAICGGQAIIVLEPMNTTNASTINAYDANTSNKSGDNPSPTHNHTTHTTTPMLEACGFQHDHDDD